MKMICTRACVLKGRGPCDKGDVVDVAPDRADDVFVKDHFRMAEVPPPPGDVPPPQAEVPPPPGDVQPPQAEVPPPPGDVPPPQAEVPHPPAEASDEKAGKGRGKAVNAADLPFMKGN